MSQRWLKFLERLGAPARSDTALPDDLLFRHVKDFAWYEFCHYELLFRLYGPPPDSPWFPYHCPTLFAAIDRLRIAPRPIQMSSEVAAEGPPNAWHWLGSNTMVIVDAPGGLSVQMGARLAIRRGAQLVSTFDHWPVANPLPAPLGGVELENIEPKPWPPQDVLRSVAIDSRDVIDSMVTLAPELFRRMQDGIAPTAPPIWMCDARRVVASKPGPGDFDNRYFIDDSILPGEDLLRQQGIEQIAYVSYKPDPLPSEDLCIFLRHCHEVGIALLSVAITEPASWAEPAQMAPPPAIPLAGRKFPKSQIGGFGVRLPVPEESSGGSFAGAGG